MSFKDRPGNKWFVVDVQSISIDSGHADIAPANDRRAEMIRAGASPGAVKVMTKPAVGGVKLDPNDAASWQPKRTNPSTRNKSSCPNCKRSTVEEDRQSKGYAHGGKNMRCRSCNYSWALVEPADIRRGARRNPEEPERGSLWMLRSPASVARRHRVYEVIGIDARRGRVEYKDSVTGEVAECPVARWHEVMTQAPEHNRNPRQNPAWMRGDDSRFTEVVPFEDGFFEVSTYILSDSSAKTAGHKQETLVFPANESGRTSLDELGGFRGPQSHKRAIDALPELVEAWRARKKWDSESAQLRAERETGMLANPRRNPRLNPRQNPGELMILNPGPQSSPLLEKAEQTYRMWHQKEPNGVSVKRPSMKDNDVMVCIGTPHDIVYRSGKWEKRKKNDYVHTWGHPKVWMLESMVDDAGNQKGKLVGELLARAYDGNGRFACAELAVPLSLSMSEEEGDDIPIHSGAQVYGAVDKKTVIIFDPQWKLIIIRGGKMFFDERGIVN